MDIPSVKGRTDCMVSPTPKGWKLTFTVEDNLTEEQAKLIGTLLHGAINDVADRVIRHIKPGGT